MYIDINANITIRYLDLNIFQQDAYFSSKLGMEVEYAKSNLKNITFSDFGDLSVASFCQSRAEEAKLACQGILDFVFKNLKKLLRLLESTITCIKMDMVLHGLTNCIKKWDG